MSKPPPARYGTTNWSGYDASRAARRSGSCQVCCGSTNQTRKACCKARKTEHGLVANILCPGPRAFTGPFNATWTERSTAVPQRWFQRFRHRTRKSRCC